MNELLRISLPRLVVLVVALFLAGCGGGDSGSGQTPVAPEPIALSSDIVALGTQQGVTPFIYFMRLQGVSLAKASTIRYSIAQKAGATSKPVHASYSKGYLLEHGYLLPESGSATIPIVGLYANYDNAIELEVVFADDSVQRLPATIRSEPYSGHLGLYNTPNIRIRRSLGQSIGFDFFYIKSAVGSPVVIDTDGELRWAAGGIANGRTSIFDGARFIIGDNSSDKMWLLGLDGAFLETRYLDPSVLNFHHNIERGKFGYLVEPDLMRGSVKYYESTVAEISTSGSVIKEWDMSKIIGGFMRSKGDDPAGFVRDGVDWFHVNASAYDASDNSLLVSSRENFVIKIDYDTGRPIWILGDPTKYWYQYPSLRAISLTVGDGGRYPIGQHAVSVRADGRLMLFNNGAASFNQPVGMPAGESRNYSAVSVYKIDATARVAHEEWSFDNAKSILSDICSSAYEANEGSLLISYATADGRSKARLVGLNGGGVQVFDFEYVSPVPCQTSWNATPIPFENLSF